VATAKDFRRIALLLEGTTEAPHFERTAFKVHRIYATLAPDERTANLIADARRAGPQVRGCAGRIFTDTKCLGARGATTAKLAKLTVAELRQALETAWEHAVPKKR
jgi:hypothetical protein